LAIAVSGVIVGVSVGISVEVAVEVGEGVSEAVGVWEGVRVNVWVGSGVSVEVGGVVGAIVTEGVEDTVGEFVAFNPEVESSLGALHAASTSARKIRRNNNVIRLISKGLCIAHLRLRIIIHFLCF
jgi:hypothetical protein